MALIAENDLVVIYENRDSQKILKIEKGKLFNNKFGTFRHDDMMGHKYGSKIMSKNLMGFIHILRLTPHLYTQSLLHRTQILFSMDISIIISNLNIKPGDVVIESGTGSGSLSYSIANAVAPDGKLYTFEFNHDRFEGAKIDFANLGVDKIAIVKEGDAIKDGFPGVDYADSIFLDLPNPWDAIVHCKALKKRGRICTFSPCIEQIQKTFEALTKQGYGEIVMYETLIRNYEHRKLKCISFDELGKRKEADSTDVWGGMKTEKAHTGYLMFGVKL
jgi:tRNA (adenine57-N1/adenine58-N1)-methyltransferase